MDQWSYLLFHATISLFSSLDSTNAPCHLHGVGDMIHVFDLVSSFYPSISSFHGSRPRVFLRSLCQTLLYWLFPFPLDLIFSITFPQQTRNSLITSFLWLNAHYWSWWYLDDQMSVVPSILYSLNRTILQARCLFVLFILILIIWYTYCLPCQTRYIGNPSWYWRKSSQWLLSDSILLIHDFLPCWTHLIKVSFQFMIQPINLSFDASFSTLGS